MGKIILTKAEAVEKYGSKRCKEHFKKYGKLQNKSVKIALEKTLKQHFEIVGEQKSGRSNVYVLEGMKSEPSVKIDRRTFNGNWDSKTMYMDLYIVGRLFEINEPEYFSYRTWLKFLLIENPMVNRVMDNRYDTESFEYLVGELVDLKIIVKSEKQLINDYLDWLDKLRKTMIMSLQRLQKLGIIKIQSQYKAFNLLTSRTEEIPEDVYLKIMTDKKQLLKQFEVTEWHIRTYQFSKQVRNFNMCFEEYLSNVYEVNGKPVPISNVFKAVQITLVAESEQVGIEMYHTIKEESICSDMSKELLLLRGLERIEEMKLNFFAKKTESFLIHYFENIRLDAQSNGFEGLELEYEKWVRKEKTEYNQEYVASHLERRYLERMLKFEQDILYEGFKVASNSVAS